jgi:hypothetical protein
VKSRFRFFAYLPPLLLFPLGAGIVNYISFVKSKPVPIPPSQWLPLIIILSFTMIWLFWGEFRTKIIKVAIDGDAISVRRFGGLGIKKTYSFSEFDGFVTSLQPYGALGVMEYLYLMKGKRKVIKLSQFYHKNYAELKAAIHEKSKYLGDGDFSFIDELKEIFV